MSNKALRILSNVRTLRVLAREVDIEKLESLAEKLNSVISERKQEIALLQTEEKERLERIEKYKEMLKKECKEGGISDPKIEALLGLKRKVNAVKAHRALQNINLQMHKEMKKLGQVKVEHQKN